VFGPFGRPAHVAGLPAPAVGAAPHDNKRRKTETNKGEKEVGKGRQQKNQTEKRVKAIKN
jgi:hypothetical protein